MGMPLGLYRRADDRVTIWCRDGSYVLFARAVVEAQIGRHLSSDEIVHHLNGDRTDDRSENLQLLPSQRRHARLHGHSWRTSRWSDRRCAGCGCDHDEHTSGCKHCRQRHAARRKVVQLT